jgi:hypothetical protein
MTLHLRAMRTNMTNTIKNQVVAGLFLILSSAACGPTFDPASLVESTRVIGARIEVEGEPDRASPKPGETADITWLVTSPDAAPPLGWTFALCAPGTGDNAAACLSAPLARFEGAATPRISMVLPSEAVLGGATSLTFHGGICAGVAASPQFEPQSGLATCPAGGHATSVSLDLSLQRGEDANHNPIADRAFTLDGAAWAAATGEPCAQGPRVTAGSKGHVIGITTQGSDRELYTAPTATREQLQISQFTTAGKLKSQFSFVEATDDNPVTISEVAWDAPDGDEVSVAGMAVTFTFVVRDDRGGTDFTTRALCVTP